MLAEGEDERSGILDLKLPLANVPPPRVTIKITLLHRMNPFFLLFTFTKNKNLPFSAYVERTIFQENRLGSGLFYFFIKHRLVIVLLNVCLQDM